MPESTDDSKPTDNAPKGSRTKTAKVGSLVEVEAGATVTRPDGSTVTVGKGGFVLDAPGIFKLGDREVVAK